MALLEVEDVTLRFGGIVALDGVSFAVEEGHISGLIGPNGAGKTTAFNVITRLYKPDTGKVELEGSSILKAPPHAIVRKGIARTFQNIQLFKTMSVLENVLVGAHGRGRRAGQKEAFEALDVVGLRERAHFPAAALPYGTQKRVELARALVAKPRLLLLDEPAGGLNHGEVAELGTFILRIRDDFELTILLVEHHMNLVMGISDHVNVLSFGRKIADGTPAQVQADPAVIEAYLGSDEDAVAGRHKTIELVPWSGAAVTAQRRTRPAFAGATVALAAAVAGIAWWIAPALLHRESVVEFRAPVGAPMVPPAIASSSTQSATAPSSAPTSQLGSPAVVAPRFVWPVQPGADGYRVALYRGSRKVFELDVETTSLELPGTWTHDGQLHILSRGTYRWFVWPLFGSGSTARIGPAIVSARYTV